MPKEIKSCLYCGAPNVKPLLYTGISVNSKTHIKCKIKKKKSTQNIDLRNVHWNFGFHFNHPCMKRWNNSQFQCVWWHYVSVTESLSFFYFHSYCLKLFSSSFSIHAKLHFTKLIWNLDKRRNLEN